MVALAQDTHYDTAEYNETHHRLPRPEVTDTWTYSYISDRPQLTTHAAPDTDAVVRRIVALIERARATDDATYDALVEDFGQPQSPGYLITLVNDWEASLEISADPHLVSTLLGRLRP